MTTNPDDVRSAVEALLSAEIDTCARDELVEVDAALVQMRGFVAAVGARAARRHEQLNPDRLASLGTTGDTGDRDAVTTDTPADPVIPVPDRRTGREIEAERERGRIGAAMPSFESALAAGQVTAGHLDALVAACNGLDDELRADFDAREADLLGHAVAEPVDVFRRRCRGLAPPVADRSRGEARRAAAGSGVGTHVVGDPVGDVAAAR